MLTSRQLVNFRILALDIIEIGPGLDPVITCHSLDQLIGGEFAPVPVNMLSKPLQQCSEFALGKLLRQIGDIF